MFATGWAAIAGVAFLAASAIALLVKIQINKNEKYEEAKRDLKKAIDSHNFNAQLDAERRMRLYKK